MTVPTDVGQRCEMVNAIIAKLEYDRDQWRVIGLYSVAGSTQLTVSTKSPDKETGLWKTAGRRVLSHAFVSTKGLKEWLQMTLRILVAEIEALPKPTPKEVLQLTGSGV